MNASELGMVKDNASAKRLAIEHGVFDSMSRTLKKITGSGVAVAFSRRGDLFYLFAAWDKFENESDNGWLCAFSKSVDAILLQAGLLHNTIDGQIIFGPLTVPPNN